MRGEMEARFGRPFDRIRTHEGEDADRWTRAGDATALTVGQHIAFSPGSFSPSTAAGRALIAHELAHAVQQGMPSVSDWRWGGRDTPSEREADGAAAAVMAGRAMLQPSSSSAGVIQREPARKLAPEPDEPWWKQQAANDNAAAETSTGDVAAETSTEDGAAESLGEEALDFGGAALAGLAAGITVFLWDEDEAAPEWGPEGPPKPQPRTNPRPDPREDPKGCIAEWVAQEGYDTCHDQCATQISGVPLEFQLTTPEGMSVSFDALDLGLTLHEVKTGYRFMLNPDPSPDLARLQEQTREHWLEQSHTQLVVANRCGYPLVWSFNDPDVAEYAAGLIEPVTEPFDCPCPERQKRKRRKRAQKHQKVSAKSSRLPRRR